MDRLDRTTELYKKYLATLTEQEGKLEQSAVKLTELRERLGQQERDLADYLTIYLDDDQRARLSGKSEADIVAALPDFRDDGRKARELDDEQRKGDHGPFGAQPNDRDDDSSLAEYNARIVEEERLSRDMETRRPK